MLFSVLIFFFFYLLLFPETALRSTQNGLLLWYSSVLPVLFPFMLLCGLLLKFDFLKHLPKFLTKPFQALFGVSSHGSFAIITGFLCGFPMGAKITSDLYSEGKISGEEARFLLGFVNNLSPAFILSFLATDQMGCPQLKLMFLGDILGAAVLYGLITSVYHRQRKAAFPEPHGPIVFHQQSIADAYTQIDACIYDTVLNTVKLGVYITIFKIISDAVFHFIPLTDPLLLFLGASIEVTGGIQLLASSGLPFYLKFILVNSLCAFGGFSALAQTVSIASLDGDALFYYIKSRVLITLLCAALSFGSILLLSFLLG
ncbi:MAG: hypothetical protein Q4C61_05985 [Lachnospiraceae bacterium]|nr:hypothetical protein [Lachnospiraceae bacterium]